MTQPPAGQEITHAVLCRHGRTYGQTKPFLMRTVEGDTMNLAAMRLRDLFGKLPSRRVKPEPQRDPSPAFCENLRWTPVADFGHAAGCDLDLGKCESCGSFVMCVWYASATYIRISHERAEFLQKLQREDPDRLRLVLKKWVDG